MAECVDRGGSGIGSHGEELLVKLAINEDEVMVVMGSTIDVIGHNQHEEKSKLIVVGGHFQSCNNSLVSCLWFSII